MNDMKKPIGQGIEELTLMLLYLTRFHDEYCPFIEASWRQYDFGTVDKLEEDGLLVKPNKSKISFLTEEGLEKARKLISEYGIGDKDILERFEFRAIRPEETEQAVCIERACFPPNEACSAENMRERIQAAAGYFLVAVDRSNGKIAGFLNGIATHEEKLRDDFFTDASLHDPTGKIIMLTGLDVLPNYRKKGLARELMCQYQRKAKKDGIKLLVLTCHTKKVGMYKKFGFTDRGISESQWGGEKWHEMACCLD